MDLNPNKLQATKILIDQLFTRVTIDQRGEVNVVQVFTPIEQEGQQGQENLLQRLVNFLALQIEGPLPIAVDLVHLNNFSSDFIDESTTPPYSAQLVITKGSLKGLSSEPSAQADFKIEGTIDQSATIDIDGQMNPIHTFQNTQVDFALNDFDLKPVSPYSGKYLGYKIDQGKLQLKLKYRVDKHRIDAKNVIEIDQLTLGEKVDSRDATDLPVALGVALLKDSSGRIMLEVPVDGNVKDPQFDIGQTIKSALTKTVDDVAKSPFSSIEEIDGIKGEDLRYLEFGAGLWELNSEATKKLNALARFINERKELTVSVEGYADRQKDATGISGKEPEQVTFDERLRAEKVQEKDSPKENVIDDHQLKQLAQTRAKQVQAYLTQQGKVTAKRVQLKPVQINDSFKKDNWGVELFLSTE
jgi:outer membrane protein OmpA-like peptidoglycan-associated protein